MNPTVSTTAPKVRRVRVYTRLGHALRKRLAEYCAAAGRSERAVIEEAVGQYLAGNLSASAARTPIDRLVEAIDNDRRQRGQEHREVEVLSEAFGRFLRLWMIVHAFTFNEPGNPAAADALAKRMAAGEELFRRLAATIAKEYLEGRRFVRDVLKVDVNAAENARE